MTHLWMRHESRDTEQRAPVTPEGAAALRDAGVRLTVERSPQRVFGDEEYAAAGCDLAEAGAWVDAPGDAVVLGIKELPPEPAELRHTHVFFGHAFKGQEGARELLERFRRGGGALLDVEYLTIEGRRQVAFGYWAGYVGAALTTMQHAGRLPVPVIPMERKQMDDLVRGAGAQSRVLVTGAKGRSGTGARDALAVAGADVTAWDVEETRVLDKPALLAHDLLVNCVVTQTPQPPFVAAGDLRADRRLCLIGDVTCDVTSENNMLPVNTAITTWDEPVRHLADASGGHPGLDVIAIDNLPSLLPREASMSFSAELVPLLTGLEEMTMPWRNALATFEEHV